MKQLLKSNTLSTGLAMFAMFFGAGNVVFPLTLGLYSQSENTYAVLGLLISAICVPFTGLIAMILFDGDYKRFFGRIGKTPGFILSALIMALIGPFGAMPRCIALAYSTLTMFAGDITLPIFSAISCVLIVVLTLRPSKILDLIGYVLTPFLLLTLGVIIIKGLWFSPGAPVSDQAPFRVFLRGLTVGYQTMDLLGAFFFSTVVIVCLKEDLHPTKQQDFKHLTKLALQATAIGAFLLSIIYIGFSFVAASHSAHLSGTTDDLLLGAIALNILGPYAGIVTSVAVALACLTTVIALASVFAEFLHKDIVQDKVGYLPCLLATVISTYFISIMNFSEIVKFLAPILSICYPALIVLSVLNLFNKLYDFKPVKAPFYLTLGATVILELLG